MVRMRSWVRSPVSALGLNGQDHLAPWPEHSEGFTGRLKVMEFNNQPISDKTIKGVIALVILLAAVYVFGYLQPAVAPGQEAEIAELKGVAGDNAPAETLAEPEVTLTKAEIPADVSKFMAELEAVFPEALNDLVPGTGEVVLGRVWFVSREYSYVEFTRGRQKARALVEASGGDLPTFEVLGYFLPGDNDWVLEQGQDRLFTEAAWVLYEYDATVKDWVLRN